MTGSPFFGRGRGSGGLRIAERSGRLAGEAASPEMGREGLRRKRGYDRGYPGMWGLVCSPVAPGPQRLISVALMAGIAWKCPLHNCVTRRIPCYAALYGLNYICTVYCWARKTREKSKVLNAVRGAGHNSREF